MSGANLRNHRPWAGLLPTVLCVGLCGCATQEPTPAPVPVPRDVLLITIDTARLDRFSYTGLPGPGTPRIDALAREGAGFVNAITPVPLTLPAHASLLTGRLPPSHTVRDNGAYLLPEAETTWAELLSEAGFTTAAFVGAEVLDERYRLNQGFQSYDDEIEGPGDSPLLYYPERSAEVVAAAASRWLDAQDDSPVFVWVHLFDPHTPYRPPQPELSRHASRYDGEIAYVDRVVGDLLDHWEARRGAEQTLVVVTSDHGEGLGEHGEPTHGVLVHDATLLVPLVIRAPGLTLDHNIAEPVSLIDLLPTVLALLRLPIPAEIQGRDLGPLLRGEPLEWSPASGYAESLYAKLHHGCTSLETLRERRWKLVRGLDRELYDLAADPGESRDLADSEPERTAELGRTLEDLVAEIQGADAERVTLDEQTRRALEALGYVWSTPAESQQGELRDPREALQSMSQMADADRRLIANDLKGAIAGYRSVIEAEPASVDARVRLAQVFISQESGAEALRLLTEALALAPHESLLYQKLGFTLARFGKYDEGLATFEAGLSRFPDERGLRIGRWQCLYQLGRLELLLAETERAIAHDSADDGMTRHLRALACCGQPQQAYLAALERELAELPGDPTLESALARARADGN